MNPYDSPSKTFPPSFAPRTVWRYLISSLILFLIAALVAYPGCYLVNQEWQIIRTETFLTSFECGGKQIPLSCVQWISLSVGGILLIASICSGAIGLANIYKNENTQQQSALVSLQTEQNCEDTPI
jgi:hypothetical protein